ncbi:hypothetical protein M9H77_20839 [Catharanthus roseus]|uniref:Uncharacterized protein n=1 Tax=Catharanthus roseus TaxID=4058 RepID=A0ACC0APV2_CATRO|nr:hypothetical protein M9H77_20839 [Catharanthus roseus]
MVQVNNANVGRGGHGKEGRGSKSGKKGKGKQVARSETPLDNFILVKATADYKDWTKKKRKIAPMFQYFKVAFFGPSDHIGIGKIHNQNTLKRMGFSRNEDRELIRGGQEEESENREEEEEGNETESMDEDEKNIEEIQRELRQKKRQERTKEGQSSVNMGQLMARIITMQSQFNSRLDDIDGKLHNRFDDINDKIVDIQNRVMRLERGGR